MVATEVTTFTFLFQIWNVPLPSAIVSNFRTLIGLITAFLAGVNFSRDLYINPNPLPTDSPLSYDFVIVGSGSAGSVVANRLSENGIFTVLLLEAGGDPLILNDIPYLTGSNFRRPETDWMYSTVPQRHSCFAFPNNTMQWVRGRSLGGCSNLNNLVYMRGNPNDFDNWANLTKDDQWAFKNVLPYFKKIENYQGSFPADPKFHGTKGPLRIQAARFSPMLNDWLSAGLELGLPIADPNAQQIEALFPADNFVANGLRLEQYHGYIEPALKRPNLKIIRYARVTKVNLDSSNLLATGVNYIRNGKKFTVLASKEVILSAGAIGSPQLLMLSGIGPANHLKSIGIIPKLDLPGVGQHLIDHWSVMTGPFILNDSVSFIPERDLSTKSALAYLNSRTGPIASSSLNFQGHGLISTTGESTWPNVQTYFSPSGISENTLSTGGFTIPNFYRTYMKGFEGRDALYIYTNLVRPKSIGTITLRSNDPFDDPLIDPNYLAHPDDIKAAVAGFKFAIRLFEGTRTFQKYNATLIPNHLPGCEAFPLRTDEYFACYFRHLTGTPSHPCSTCKMGHIGDPMAVVDTNLRVKSIQGLRIVDASIMPYITNANLNAPVAMIGEKASELILREYIV